MIALLSSNSNPCCSVLDSVQAAGQADKETIAGIQLGRNEHMDKFSRSRNFLILVMFLSAKKADLQMLFTWLVNVK